MSEKQQSLRLFERQSSTLPGNVKSLLNERLWYIQSIAKVRSNALRLAIPFRVINENLCDKFCENKKRARFFSSCDFGLEISFKIWSNVNFPEFFNIKFCSRISKIMKK